MTRWDRNTRDEPQPKSAFSGVAVTPTYQAGVRNCLGLAWNSQAVRNGFTTRSGSGATRSETADAWPCTTSAIRQEGSLPWFEYLLKQVSRAHKGTSPRPLTSGPRH